MMLSDPFNTMTEVLSFTSFRQGSGGPSDLGDTLRQSVLDGTFALSQFTLALRQARNEIYSRCGGLDNDDYSLGRAAQLTEAELYLARSRLIEQFAEKTAAKFAEANLQSVGNVMQGADTPSPYEKMEVWRRIARLDRQRGEALLTGQGNAWSIEVGTETISDPYPCLAPGVYSVNQTCNNCEVL